MSSDWSPELQALTREHLSQLTFGSRDGVVAFKRFDGAYGTMRVVDAVNGNWVITENETGVVSRFGTIEVLIAAGWAID